MKTKLYTLVLLLFLSHFAFGQSNSLNFEDKIRLRSSDCAHSHICCQVKCPCCPNYGKIDFGPNIPLNSQQIKFAQEVYTLEKTYLREKVNPTDTINIERKKYLLKFVEKIGWAPTYEESLKFASNITYFCTKYGNDYIVIGLSRNTAMSNVTNYFCELIKEN